MLTMSIADATRPTLACRTRGAVTVMSIVRTERTRKTARDATKISSAAATGSASSRLG